MLHDCKMGSNTCRVCLNKKGIISVFDKGEDRICYSTKIMRCASVIMTENDGFPTMICEECICELHVTHSFVERCEASDKILRNLPPTLETVINAPLAELSPLDVKNEADHQTFDDTFLQEDFQIEAVEDQKPKNQGKIKRKRPKKGPVKCDYCCFVAACPSALEIHMRSHTGEKPFQCDTCSMRFTTKGGMKRHITNNHSKRERRFTCETCGNSFFTRADIITHIRIHTNEKPYVCSECSISFRQIASLIRHRRIHTGERPYPCPTCGKCFADRHLVKKHQSVHSSDKKFICQLCNKAMKTRNALKNHMKLHSNEKKNICNYCGMAFAMKGNLNIHIKRMHSENSGECTICLKTFPNIEEHIRKHTGEKPYTCAYCGSTYSTNRSLNRHIMFKHANADKFKCSFDDCSASFPSHLMLEYHTLKHHTHETPYICQFCSRGFYRTSDLSRHIKVTHLAEMTPFKSTDENPCKMAS